MNKLKDNEIEWIAQKLNEHVWDGLILSSEDIEFYANSLSERFLFEGEAYRVVLVEYGTVVNESLNKNRCWSASTDALREFIKNQKRNSDICDHEEIIFKAKIRGLKVNELIKYINKNTEYEIHPAFDFEDEIIAVEMLSQWEKIK